MQAGSQSGGGSAERERLSGRLGRAVAVAGLLLLTPVASAEAGGSIASVAAPADLSIPVPAALPPGTADADGAGQEPVLAELAMPEEPPAVAIPQRPPRQTRPEPDPDEAAYPFFMLPSLHSALSAAPDEAGAAMPPFRSHAEPRSPVEASCLRRDAAGRFMGQRVWNPAVAMGYLTPLCAWWR